MDRMRFRQKLINWITWCISKSFSILMNGKKLISQIRWCISTRSFSILVNGTPPSFFQSSRGLRRPILSTFVCTRYGGTQLPPKEHARKGGFLFGFKLNGRVGEGMEVSHLLFVDDTLVFCKASQAQMTYLSLLMWFKTILGLKINLIKSKLIPMGRVKYLDELAFKSRSKVGGFPTSYLGLPLGAPYNSLAAWDETKERFHKRFFLFSFFFLFWWGKGGGGEGGFTLIQSNLSSLSIYIM